MDIWGIQWVDTEAKHSLKSKIQHRRSESLGRVCRIAAPPPLEASFLPNPCPPLRQIRTLKGLLHPYWKIKTVLLGGSSPSGKTQVPAGTLMLFHPAKYTAYRETCCHPVISLCIYIPPNSYILTRYVGIRAGRKKSLGPVWSEPLILCVPGPLKWLVLENSCSY